jgi:phosphate transport system substrate-binding protein
MISGPSYKKSTSKTQRDQVHQVFLCVLRDLVTWWWLLGKSSTKLASWVLIGLVIFATSCRALPTPRPSVRFEFVGADSMAWIAKTIATEYSDHRPDVAFSFKISNSDAGVHASEEYSRTIGLVSRIVKPDEIPGKRAVAVALDGVAVIVSKSNPINSITSGQVVQVFDGEIITWPTGAIAGKNILAVSREEGSGTRDAFQTMVMKGQRVTRTAVVMPSESSAVNFVAKNPEAIGYVSMGAVTPEVHALSVDSITLSPHTVETLQYPFVRTLAFIIPLGPDGEMQDLMDFVLGSDGQSIVGQKYGRINP